MEELTGSRNGQKSNIPVLGDLGQIEKRDKYP
jgi:hypothetical protein